MVEQSIGVELSGRGSQPCLAPPPDCCLPAAREGLTLIFFGLPSLQHFHTKIIISIPNLLYESPPDCCLPAFREGQTLSKVNSVK